MILIISDESDAHCRYVVEKLESRSAEALILDTSKFPTNISIAIEIHADIPKIVFEVEGRKVEGREIQCVWNRRKLPTMLPDRITTKAIREYIARESEVFLESLPHFLDLFWVSSPDAISIASRKPYQLLLAKKLGLRIPDTFIGNFHAEAENFIDKQNELALKAICMPAVEVKSEANKEIDALRLYTRRLHRMEIKDFLPQIRNCPTILQPYIKKDFELRITVAGNSVFPCAIYSQATERTQEDWRRYDLANTPHKTYELPKAIKEKCIALVKELGLVFGCIDMIVTPDGDYVFLEINPNGQWLWIERLTDMPIGDALAEMLIAGKVI